MMISGFLEMPVTVNYGTSSSSLPKWSGTGATDRYWPKTQLEFETNIGKVLILTQATWSDGKHHIEFIGSGDPRGPLAEAMGQST